jgi:hypothetical protein
MSDRKACVFIGLVALGLAVVPSAVAGADATKEAVEAAGTWLKIVDSEQYAKSWETASQLFRAAVRVEQWEQSMTGIRRPFGKVLMRKLKSKEYATSLPGAPDGEYVIIQFETSFEKKRAAIETVTPMLDNDGEWRVSGYFIK